MYKIIDMATAVWNFLNGRFGRKTLRHPYRVWWATFWFLLILWLFFRYIMCSIFKWWDGVVYQLNYVIWG